MENTDQKNEREQLANTIKKMASQIESLYSVFNPQPTVKSNELSLGFQSAPPPNLVHVFVGEADESSWYTLAEGGKKVPITQDCLVGTVKRLSIKAQKSEKYGVSSKLVVDIIADKNYRLQSGTATTFSKGLVASLNELKNLNNPVKIVVKPGEDNKVVLVSVYDNTGNLILGKQSEYSTPEAVKTGAEALCKKLGVEFIEHKAD